MQDKPNVNAIVLQLTEILEGDQQPGSLFITWKNNIAAAIVDILKDYQRQYGRKTVPENAFVDIAYAASKAWLDTLLIAGKMIAEQKEKE